MVADTLGTTTSLEAPLRRSGYRKLVYSSGLNAGFAAWGKAWLAGKTLDAWIDDLLDRHSSNCSSLRSFAELLVREMNRDMKATGKTWMELGRRGVHIAGFQDGHPLLLHAHMGPEDEIPGQVLLEDTVAVVQGQSASGPAQLPPKAVLQLRNGVHNHFIRAHERDIALSGWGSFECLDDRIDYYRPLFAAVADDTPAIDREFAFLAITSRGLLRSDVPSRAPWAADGEWKESIEFKSAV